MYLILKHIKRNKTIKKEPVILIDSQSEILELEKIEDAKNLCDILNSKNYLGRTYSIRQV